jgi:hypothetical protein
MPRKLSQTGAGGQPAPLARRLLLTPAEGAQQVPAIAGAARFVCGPGWTSLSGYPLANLAEIVRRRD